jgi:hypothetical protein
MRDNMKTTVAIVIAALLALAGCDRGQEHVTASTVVERATAPSILVTTVRHNGCDIIVGTTGRSDGGMTIMHSPTCPNPAHQPSTQPVER